MEFMIYFCAGKSLVHSLNRLRPTKVDPAELAGRCCRQYFSCTNKFRLVIVCVFDFLVESTACDWYRRVRTGAFTV